MEAEHFMEHDFDRAFNLTCDKCAVEIEFLLFTCVGCRVYSLCETCYHEQLTDIEMEPVAAAKDQNLVQQSLTSSLQKEGQTL